MSDLAILYGSPLSLYTGRARSYLIKAQIPYRETTPTTKHYRDTVVPAAGGRQGVPTLELGDGGVIRDGAAIIDHYEAARGHTFSPATPKQRILSRLFDVIGAEGLLRPAMHYRWNFPEQNLDFLRFHFQSMMPPSDKRAEKAEAAANRMRAAAVGFGVVPETRNVVETHYKELLQKLNQHFPHHPYLLGGRPSIGDFGMIAPLYGHLGRDPMPLSIMQAQAIRVFRWVERMNRPEPDVGEFADQSQGYLPNDEVPDTLIDVLRHVAEDFIPETRAACECINTWLDGQEDLVSGTALLRGVGTASFELRSQTINALAQPYRFYLLKRVQDEYEAMGSADQAAVSDMLSSCGAAEVLDFKLSREIGRANNLEVWG